jgi:hypothetical protein
LEEFLSGRLAVKDQDKTQRSSASSLSYGIRARFMFNNARFQQGFRRTRRWRRLSTISFGKEKRCNHPGLYQVELAKREDMVRKAGKT